MYRHNLSLNIRLKQSIEHVMKRTVFGGKLITNKMI
jgi:hypothetical protein